MTVWILELGYMFRRLDSFDIDGIDVLRTCCPDVTISTTLPIGYLNSFLNQKSVLVQRRSLKWTAWSIRRSWFKLDGNLHWRGRFVTIVDGRLSQIHLKRMSSFGYVFRRPPTFAKWSLSQNIHFRRSSNLTDRTLLKTVHFRKPPTSSRLDHFSLLTFYSDVTRHALRICILGALTKIVSYWAFIDTQFTILICNCTFPIIKTFSRSRYFSSVTRWTACAPFWPFAPVGTTDVP